MKKFAFITAVQKDRKGNRVWFHWTSEEVPYAEWGRLVVGRFLFDSDIHGTLSSIQIPFDAEPKLALEKLGYVVCASELEALSRAHVEKVRSHENCVFCNRGKALVLP